MVKKMTFFWWLLSLVMSSLPATSCSLFVDPSNKSNLTYTAQAKGLLQSSPEVYYLLKGLGHATYHQRFTSLSALHYVLFWSQRERTTFLVLCSSFLSKLIPSNSLRNLMQNYASTANWFMKLSPHVRADLRKRNNGKTFFSSFPFLVRIVRNYIVHYIENQNTVVGQTIGNEPEAILHYFTTIFPSLMSELYDFIHINRNQRNPNVEVFSSYFEK
uniref:Serine/threonine-protein kinase/endoribonuclease ire-1 n=1 Tax=Noccaea caerulescens TaxID=107243 RepID=A0A1J3E8A0_NOCCA